jgi:hypothetical protein
VPDPVFSDHEPVFDFPNRMSHQMVETNHLSVPKESKGPFYMESSPEGQLGNQIYGGEFIGQSLNGWHAHVEAVVEGSPDHDDSYFNDYEMRI